MFLQVTCIVQKGTITPSCYTNWRNDSYLTQWDTKSFQNIKLVSHYSKLVSRKNSKCLDFVLVQITCIVQKRHNVSLMLHKIKNDYYSSQWHTKGLRNINLTSHYSKSVSRKNSKCVDLVLVQLTPIVQKFPISPSCCQRSKNNSYSRKWLTKGFHNIQLFPIIQSQWAVKIPNVLSLCWYK